MSLSLSMAPPRSVIKIVKYCCVWGGGRQNPTKDNGALSHCIKIDKYCGTRGREGIGGGGSPKSYKNNGVPHLCH